MPKTFNDAVYSLLEIVTNFSVTDDVEYPVKWVEDALISVHNTLMREARRQHTLGDELLLMHKNIKVKPLEDKIQDGDVTINPKTTFCYVEIPELVSGIDQIPLNYVGPVTLDKPYSYKTFQSINDSKGSVWSLNVPNYSIIGDRVLFEKTALKGTKYVSVIAYFRDPRDANTYDPDDAFPTPSEYKLELLGLQHMFQSKNISPDLINEAQRAIQPVKRSRSRSKKDDDYYDD